MPAGRRAAPTPRAIIDVEIQDARWLTGLRMARVLCRRAALQALATAPRRTRANVALAIALADDADYFLLIHHKPGDIQHGHY